MFKNVIRFIAYADIHHSKMGAGCLTIYDSLKIEEAILDRAYAEDFDFTLFAGDRFLLRDPEDEIKTRADNLFSRYRGVSNLFLVGNHDWVDRSKSWHTYNSFRNLNNEELIVMDKPGCVSLECGACIHHLPSGFSMEDMELKEHGGPNILVFHDIIRGCFVSENLTMNEGLSIETMDYDFFDLVLGGDVHVPQMLPFKNTRGGYIGAVMQRNMGDAIPIEGDLDQRDTYNRGYLEVEALMEGDKWRIDHQFIPVRNFFTRITFNVNDRSAFDSINISDELVNDRMMEVSLVGKKEDVDRVADDSRWNNYMLFGMARGVNVIRKYEGMTNNDVVDMSKSNGVLDDLEIYINSGFVDMSGVDKESLKKTLVEVSGKV